MRNTEHPSLDPLLTVPQVAAYLGWSLQTIYSLVNRRRIPYVKVGRSLRFRRSTVEALCIEHPALDAEVRR